MVQILNLFGNRTVIIELDPCSYLKVKLRWYMYVCYYVFIYLFSLFFFSQYGFAGNCLNYT